MDRRQPGRLQISIHALREEGDDLLRLSFADCGTISIHALREEGDGCSTTTTPSQTYFYPRPPRGGRPAFRSSNSRPMTLFLSTPSARRATQSRRPAMQEKSISIHALREEGDENLV